MGTRSACPKLSNKGTGSQSQPRFCCYAARGEATGEREDTVVVEVVDTGVGMTEDVRARIFDPLVRGYAMGSLSMTCYGIGAEALKCSEPEGAADVAGQHLQVGRLQAHDGDQRCPSSQSEQKPMAIVGKPGDEGIKRHGVVLGGPRPADQAAAALGLRLDLLPRKLSNPTSHDDCHLRARGRSIPPSGSRGWSLTAAMSAGWT